MSVDWRKARFNENGAIVCACRVFGYTQCSFCAEAPVQLRSGGEYMEQSGEPPVARWLDATDYHGQVPAPDATRTAPTPDVPHVRGMGFDGVAALLGLEPIWDAPEGVDFPTFASWAGKAIERLAQICARNKAEIDRLLRLYGDDQAAKPWCGDPDCGHAPDGGNHPVVPGGGS